MGEAEQGGEPQRRSTQSSLVGTARFPKRRWRPSKKVKDGRALGRVSWAEAMACEKLGGE